MSWTVISRVRGAVVEVQQDDLLPSAETELAVLDRNGQGRPEEGSAQMGKTVVVAPAVVVVITAIGGNDFFDELFRSWIRPGSCSMVVSAAVEPETNSVARPF